MEQDVAIEVKNISKSFKVSYDRGKTIKDKLLFGRNSRSEELQVLKDVSFTVKKGEAVGLIGHNGCGKSTTLKLLTRIIYPDAGSIEIDGRVSSLLELGAGFHPDMSGRENIYTNASIFGLTKKEIDKRIDDIIAFSELEDFIDNPVRTYSSGMYMRLAFSVAINVNADILLIDEILAVGDSNFQYKCGQKMQEIKKQGTTIIIVSHSMGQIEELCDRTIWLNEGKIVEDDAPYFVHKDYLEYMAGMRKIRTDEEKKAAQEAKDLDLAVTSVDCINSNREYQCFFDIGDDVGTIIHYQIKKEQKGYARWSVIRSDNVVCYECDTKEITFKQKGIMELWLQDVKLLPGHYTINMECYTKDGNLISSIGGLCYFDIYTTTKEKGVCRIEHSWKMVE